MEVLEEIKSEFIQYIQEDYDKIVLECKIFTKEIACSGVYYLIRDNHEINLDLALLSEEGIDVFFKVIEWYSETGKGDTWNKATYILFKDGHFETETWWDEQFYQEVYNEPSGRVIN
jgi:hypothetical protein